MCLSLLQVTHNNIQNNAEEKDNDNGHDNNICLLCFEVARVDKIYGQHVCKVKGSFRCSNGNCNQTWSSRLTRLDPQTRQPKEQSHCKHCNSVGTFTSFQVMFNNRSQQGEDAIQNGGALSRDRAGSEGGKNGHLRGHCGGCKKYGDCRYGMFVQPSTFEQGLTLLNQDQNLSIDTMQNGCIHVQFSGEHERRYQFYISSFVYIL